MMNKRNRVVDLPEDLVVEEVMYRVPTVSLARLRSTSKRWNALVKDGRFAKKHSANAPRQSLAILLTDFRVYLVSVDLRGIHDNVVPSPKVTTHQFTLKDPRSTNSTDEVDIRNVFHCDGLLLCTTKDDRLVVWNPCSGYTRWIQPRNSYMQSDLYALGYDNKSCCYKILRIDQGHRGITLSIKYEIYDFASNSWRVVVVTTDWYLVRRMRCGGVSVKGNSYWLACKRRQCRPYFLLRFDFSTERFQSEPLPPLYNRHHCIRAFSVVKEEELCLVTSKDGDPFDVDVWMTSKIESNGVIMSWTKFLTAKTERKFGYTTSFVADKQKKVLVCCSYGSEFPNQDLHIVAEDRHIQVDHDHASKSRWPFLLSYVPTLVQIQQGL